MIRPLSLALVFCCTLAWAQAPVPKIRSRYFTTLTNPEIEEYLKHNDVIFIPVGTAESMGAFPTDLEYVMSEAYALKMAEEADGLVLPHLLYFYPGVTVTGRGSVHVNQDVSLAYLKAVAHSLLRQGFRRQIYLSAHGPSDQYVSALVRTFFDETKDPILYIDVMRVLRNAQASGAAPEATGTNNFTAVGYGAYQLLGRLGDVPLSLNLPRSTTEALPPPPASVKKLSQLGPPSGAFGSYEADANHGAVRPLNTVLTPDERARLAQQGAAMIEAAVKAMDVKDVIQALRDEDKYVNTVIVPRYRDVLPK